MDTLQIAEDYVASCNDASDGAGSWGFLPGTYSGHQIAPDLVHIEDGYGVSCYLILGEEKGLLIDTGMNSEPLLQYLRSWTSLPVELAVTHGHPDHLMHADEFERVYIGKEDLQILKEVYEIPRELSESSGFSFQENFPREIFVPVCDGDSIQCGNICLEVYGLPGHTPGSKLFVDHRHRIIFTGDSMACGSEVGLWMFFNYSPSLSVYQKSLAKVIEVLRKYPEYLCLGGHFFQSLRGTRQKPVVFGPGIEMAEALKELCEQVLDGRIKLQKSDLPIRNVFRCSNEKIAIEFRMKPSVC